MCYHTNLNFKKASLTNKDFTLILPDLCNLLFSVQYLFKLEYVRIYLFSFIQLVYLCLHILCRCLNQQCVPVLRFQLFIVGILNCVHFCCSSPYIGLTINKKASTSTDEYIVSGKATVFRKCLIVLCKLLLIADYS